jgi:cobalt-zinc-cadmium efflux system outer membrane protein
MIASRSRRALRTLALAVLAGCATVDPRVDFEQVRTSAAERGLKALAWRSDAEQEKEADAAVDALLAEEIDADRAVQLALLENRALQAVYEELGIGRGVVFQASRVKNPLVGAEYRFAEGGGTAGVHVSIVEEFLSILFLPMRKRLAELEFEAKKLEVTSAVLALAGEVRSRFYRLQAAEQEREMRESIVRATDASFDLASRLHAAGNFRDLDLANERALHEEARLGLERAVGQAAREREDLNGLLGLWGRRTGWQMARRLPDPPGDPLATAGIESQVIERSLDLERARRELQAEAGRLGLERAQRWVPELEAGVSAEREPKDGTWSVGPSVTLPIPLFDQGQGSVAVALATLRQREQRYAAVAVAVRAEIRGVMTEVLSAQRRARHLREVLLPLRARIVAQTQLQYNAMQVGAFQLLQARRDEIESGAQYVGALRDYWLARSDLDQLRAGGRATMERAATGDGAKQGSTAALTSGH